MKILVKDLKPNPFRKIDKYPIDKEKVEELKNSINETEFWDNIIAREKNECFEIAYGHHRLEALKELEIKEVDIPVKDLDDAMMIKIMANENMDTWKTTTSVMLETVLTAKEYLESELKKYDSWETLNKSIKRFFDKFNFQKMKQEGVGQTTLVKFLGANWKQWMIQKALSLLDRIDSDVIDKDAILKIDKLGYADNVAEILSDNKVPKEKQKKIIDKVLKNVGDIPKEDRKGKPINKNTRYKAAVEEAIEDEGYETTKKNMDKIFPHKKEHDPDEALLNCTKKLSDITVVLSDVLDLWDDIDEEIRIDFQSYFTDLLNLIKDKMKGRQEWERKLLK